MWQHPDRQAVILHLRASTRASWLGLKARIADMHTQGSRYWFRAFRGQFTLKTLHALLRTVFVLKLLRSKQIFR